MTHRFIGWRMLQTAAVLAVVAGAGCLIRPALWRGWLFVGAFALGLLIGGLANIRARREALANNGTERKE